MTPWSSLEALLRERGLLDQVGLRSGASENEIVELEEHIGVRLPDEFRVFWSIHDGQDGVLGVFSGERLLSLRQIRQEWDAWRSIDEPAMNDDCADFMASQPLGFIKPLYSNSAWIPFTSDHSGNHIGIDYDPDVAGQVGQVIRFGRDEDTKVLLAPNFAAFIEGLTEEPEDYVNGSDRNAPA